ncbi:MAG: arginine--tRNA ligase [Candidatus Levybacteria bacterium]|nr:arginine--tRNA ligase [Candidatus Levybacteria bacterium]
MLNVRQQVAFDLRRVLKNLVSPDRDIIPQLEHPMDEKHGDYASNIALAIFSSSKFPSSVGRQVQSSKFGSPMELAEEIVKKLNSSSATLPNIAKVEAVKPGFINFYLSQNYLITLMIHIIRVSEGYGASEKLKNKKIMVEFTDPNPFKEFHIGHLYSNTVGESISRMLEALGANVKRANYQGDVGMHVAKAIYGIQNLEIKIEDLEKKSLKEKIKILGEAYANGSKKYEDDENVKKEIEELNKKIYDKEPDVTALYEKGRQWSLEYFEEIYKRLGTKFDFYYFESEVGRDGLKLVKEYLKKGIFEESLGAVIFPGEKYGLHDRVFINSLGLPTYEAKELGLALKKYQDFKFDQSIVVTGNEIIGYFKVILVALGEINPELATKTKHLSHGMVRLPTGKMSSRTGNILTGEWLLDEAKSLLKGKFNEMEEDILEKVTVGSIKYALLKSSLGRDIEFDFEESINIQGNSGPYLQYTFARTQSVLAKAEKDLRFKIKDLRIEPEEISLLRTLSRFQEIVEEAANKFAPNLLCNYLFDLAQKFNLFYQRRKILGEIGDIRDFRIALTKAVGQVIKNGLHLLGIDSPEKM